LQQYKWHNELIYIFNDPKYKYVKLTHSSIFYNRLNYYAPHKTSQTTKYFNNYIQIIQKPQKWIICTDKKRHHVSFVDTSKICPNFADCSYDKSTEKSYCVSLCFKAPFIESFLKTKFDPYQRIYYDSYIGCSSSIAYSGNFHSFEHYEEYSFSILYSDSIYKKLWYRGVGSKTYKFTTAV
jgi:hypothetical protein